MLLFLSCDLGRGTFSLLQKVNNHSSPTIWTQHTFMILKLFGISVTPLLYGGSILLSSLLGGDGERGMIQAAFRESGRSAWAVNFMGNSVIPLERYKNLKAPMGLSLASWTSSFIRLSLVVAASPNLSLG